MTERPVQYAGCYSLDLYCDQPVTSHTWEQRAGFPSMFTGETFTECTRDARKIGWKIHLDTRTATCPTCRKKMKED